MGSLDIPPFLRQKQKEQIEAASGKSVVPPFLKKKDTTNSNDGGTAFPLNSQVQSQSNEDKPPVNDAFSAETYVKPTVNDLDIVERSNLNKKIPVPYTFSPEKHQGTVQEVIDERKIPAKQHLNALEFIKQDMDKNPDMINSFEVPHPERFKQQVLDGDAGNNIGITTYINKRTQQLDDKIQLAQNNYDISYSNATSGTGSTSKENWDKINAYKAQADELQSYKDVLQEYSTKLLKGQVVKGTPPPKDATPEAMKNYFRDIGVSVNAIDHPEYTDKKLSSIKDGNDTRRNQEIVQLEDYQAASQGIETVKNNLDVQKGLGQISQEDYDKGVSQVKLQQSRLFDYYPKAKDNVEYQVLGQILEKRRAVTDPADPTKTSSLFHNLIYSGYTDEEIRNAAKEMGKDESWVTDHINKKNDIKGTSFMANVYNQFIAHGAQEIVSPIISLATKGRLRTDEEVESERYERDKQFQLGEGQQFDAPETIIDANKTKIDETGKRIPNLDYLQEINNPNAGNHNWGYGALNRVGDAVGGLGKLLVTTELTGGLGDLALGGKIGAEVAIGENLKQIQQFTQQQRNLFGNVVGLTLTGYNDNKVNGKEAGMNDDEANVYALTKGMETGLVFRLGFSPQKLLSKITATEEKQAAKSFAELIPKDGIEGLDKNKWAEYLKNNLAVKLGVEGLAENAKATTTMAIDQAVGFATQSMFAPQSVAKRNFGNELMNEGLKNYLTFAPISFLGAAASSLKNPHENQSQIEQEAMYRMGQSPELYADYANQQATDGKISQQDANKRIQLVNTMNKIIAGGIVPKELSRSEKIEYSNNLLHSYALDQQIEKGVLPKEQIEIKEKQIEDLKNQRAEILKNSNGVETDDSGKPLIRSAAPAPTESFSVDGKPSTRQEVEEILKGGQKEADKYGIQYEGTDDAIHAQLQAVGGTTENNVTTSPKSRETVLSEGVNDLYGRLEDKAPAHYLDPLDKQKSIEGLTNQVLESPNDIKNDVGKKLAVELIARNSTEDINNSIEKWQTIADKTGENVDEKEKKEANRHIELLNEGLEEKGKIHEAVAKPIENEGINTDGETVGGEPPPEQTGANENELGDSQTGITHAQTAETRKDAGLPEYEKTVRKDEELNEMADKAIKDGYNIEGLLSKMDKGVLPSDVEQTIMKHHIASLEIKVDKDPSNENLSELKRAVDLSDRVGGSEVARSLRSRQGSVLRDDSMAGLFIKEMDATGTSELTDKQKQTVEKEYKDISEAEKKLNDKVASLEAENAKLKADKEIKKQPPGTKKTKKEHGDFVEERKKITESIFEKLKKARGESSVTIVPYAKELFAIAPDVAKLVKSYVEEGITKLDEVVKKIHEELKPAIPNITDRDVYDLIAGEYNEKKSTRSELAIKLENLRMESKLINKLDDLKNKPEAKNERAKVFRNREIESLRQKIKDFEKEKRESQFDEKELKSHKTRISNDISKIEGQLKSGDFTKEERSESLKLDKEAIGLKDNLLKLKEDREIRLMKEEYGKRSLGDKILRGVGQVINVGRVAKSSFDVSMPLRQGLWGVTKELFALPVGSNKYFRQQRQLAEQFGKMYRALGSEKISRRIMSEIHESPRYDIAQKSGLAISEPHSKLAEAREEIYGPSLAERFPIIGKGFRIPTGSKENPKSIKIGGFGLIQASERAATTFVNTMKWDIYNNFVDLFEKQGKTFENAPDIYEAAATYANQSVGRGKLGDKLEKANAITSKLFFSLRLQASRLQLMSYLVNPRFYTKVPKEIRIAYLADMAKFVSLGVATMAIANSAGLSVGLNPYASNFGKIKAGSTDYDVWGGFGQWATLVSRLIGGKTTDKGGHTKKMGSGYRETSRADVLARFSRSKLSPEAGTVVNLLSGKNYLGQETDAKTEALQYISPLIYQDAQQAFKSESVSQAIITTVLAAHGVSVATYDHDKK